MPQPFTVRSPAVAAPGVLATFDDAGNLILAGKLVQNGLVRPGADHVEIPPGVTPGALAVNNNLSDLSDPAAARVNLGVSGSSGGQAWPLAGTGLLAASGEPNEFQHAGPTASNDRFFVRIWIPAGVPLTNMWLAVTTAGTWDGVTGPNQLVLFDDTAAQLAVTPDTGTTWTTAGWRGGALSVAQPAQGTGRYVYGQAIFRGMTAGAAIAFPVSAADNQAWFATGPAGSGATHRRGIYSAGTSNPASFDPTSFGTPTSYIPLIGFT
jgi:hypothetical protein